MAISVVFDPPLFTDSISTFNAKAFGVWANLNPWTTQANALAAQVNSDASSASGSAAAALSSKNSAQSAQAVALAAANYKGNWSALTGALAIPASVSHSSRFWMLTASTADVTTITPGVSGSWQQISDVQGLGASIASAATVNLDAATGETLHITGNTGISAFTLAAGAKRTIIFDGTPAVANSASLILPGLANITVAAGDRMDLVGEGSSITRCLNFTRANGYPTVAPPSGLNLIAVVNASGASSVDAEWSTTAYDQIVLEFSGLTCSTDSVNLTLRMKVGGAYDTGSNYSYSVMALDTGSNGFFSSGTAGTPQSSVVLASGVGNAASKSMDLTVCAHNPQSTAFSKRLDLQGSVVKSGGQTITINGVCVNGSTSALTGVRVTPSGGTLTCVVRIYGKQNS